MNAYILRLLPRVGAIWALASVVCVAYSLYLTWVSGMFVYDHNMELFKAMNEGDAEYIMANIQQVSAMATIPLAVCVVVGAVLQIISALMPRAVQTK